jgi:hypothetical protein
VSHNGGSITPDADGWTREAYLRSPERLNGIKSHPKLSCSSRIRPKDSLKISVSRPAGVRLSESLGISCIDKGKAGAENKPALKPKHNSAFAKSRSDEIVRGAGEGKSSGLIAFWIA